MSIARDLVSHLAVRYVVLGPMVFRLRRITSAELQAAGHAELVGASSAVEALRQVQADQRMARRRDPVKAAASREHDERIEQAKRQRHLDEQLSTPEGVAAWMSRLDAYIVAAVDGAARLRQEAEVTDRPTIGRYDVLPSGVRIEAYTDGPIAPFRFVADASAEDLDADLMWVGRFDFVQRQALGMAAIALQDVSAEVRPFRGGAGVTDDPPSAG